MRIAALVLAGLCLLPACAPKRVAVLPPAAVAPGPSPSDRLAAADKLFHAGCLDCLVDALAAYEVLRAEPVVAVPATHGAVRSAALIALRERGLGMSDSQRLVRARSIVETDADLSSIYADPLAIVDASPLRTGRVIAADLATDDARRRSIQQNRLRWMEMLRATADSDPFLATLWVSFSCANSLTNEGRTREGLLAPLSAQRTEPLVLFEVATCGTADTSALDALVADEPGFKEAAYWLGFRALRLSKLDDAQVLFADTYTWHPQWPGAAVALAGIFMTAEELEPALDFYNRALALLPGLSDAMVGRVRALSYMGKYDEAIARVNEFIEQMPADGYYWRAWNRNQLNDIEGAWSDIERAERLWSNSEVAKLGGVIAYRRKEIEVARDRFEKARRLNSDDCESHFYLGGVQAELRAWAPSADVYVTAVRCLQDARVVLVDQIAEIQASTSAPERKARLIASREEKIATSDRMVRQSWFNLAANYFNLGRLAEAASYAERVVDEEQYRDRAQTILSAAQKPGSPGSAKER